MDLDAYYEGKRGKEWNDCKEIRKEGGRRKKSMRTERWKGDAGRNYEQAVKTEERKGARDTKNAKRKEERWRRREECTGRVDERWREEERIDERGREENRGLVAAQTRSIRPLLPSSPPPLPRRARCRAERNLVPTRMHVPIYSGIFPFLFSDLTSCSVAPSRRIHLPIFFHPSRSRRSAILRGNVPLRWVDFLTMTLARTYCLS